MRLGHEIWLGPDAYKATEGPGSSSEQEHMVVMDLEYPQTPVLKAWATVLLGGILENKLHYGGSGSIRGLIN